jgi:ABC-type sulfate transport system permease subunit
MNDFMNKVLYTLVGLVIAVPAGVVFGLVMTLFLVTDPQPQGRDVVNWVRRL